MPKLLWLTNKMSWKSAFLAILGTSALAISCSLFAEFFLNKIPCLLCLVERGMYCVLLVASFIGAFFLTRRHLARRFCQGLLIGSFAISMYHSLVQSELLPDRCKISSQIEDLSSYKNLLLKGKGNRPSCSEASWKIGLVPIPIINGVVSVLLFSLLLKDRKKATI